MRRAIFLYSPEWEQGGYPDSCPFNSRRAGMTRAAIMSMGLLGRPDCSERAPAKATEAELLRFHTREYLEALRKAGDGELPPESFAMGLGTPDCPVFRKMYDFAAATAGATISAARLILGGEADVVFNPAGGYHHAGPDYASGFCYVNDIVLAAMVLTDAKKRVLFVDLDVHHSDGVQRAFYARNDVMIVSFHESGKTLFPGTGFEDEMGEGEGKGYSVNVPLPVGTHDGIYLEAFREVAVPLARAYDPDVIMLELGMDALAGDPLAHLNLTNNAYADCVSMVTALGKPILATGGGGYNVKNTVRGWSLAWSILCGDDAHDMMAGMGGVMLANTDWAGGLRDRMLLTDAGRRAAVDGEVRATVARVKAEVFPLHGLRG